MKTVLRSGRGLDGAYIGRPSSAPRFLPSRRSARIISVPYTGVATCVTPGFDLATGKRRSADMAEYLFLMRDDATMDESKSWEDYIRKLREAGVFEGGSAVGDGVCVRKKGAAPPVTEGLVGYIRVSAPS